nr:hypothetical protein Iba_chr02dCG16850 [Ipomoea batatas]GMC65804.1 hypothetical protein Iba_chr02dCG17530 [Ipomoea batatas]
MHQLQVRLQRQAQDLVQVEEAEEASKVVDGLVAQLMGSLVHLLMDDNSWLVLAPDGDIGYLLGMVAVELAPDWHIGHFLVDDFQATSRGVEMMMGDGSSERGIGDGATKSNQLAVGRRHRHRRPNPITSNTRQRGGELRLGEYRDDDGAVNESFSELVEVDGIDSAVGVEVGEAVARVVAIGVEVTDAVDVNVA